MFQNDGLEGHVTETTKQTQFHKFQWNSFAWQQLGGNGNKTPICNADYFQNKLTMKIVKYSAKMCSLY